MVISSSKQGLYVKHRPQQAPLRQMQKLLNTGALKQGRHRAAGVREPDGSRSRTAKKSRA